MTQPDHRHQLILTTCPDQALATTIAQALVDELLAACVNILPGVRSVYRWRGKTETAEEYLLVIKARTSAYDAIERRIRALHSYELPETIAVPIVAGAHAYLAWLDNPDIKP